MPVFLGDYQKHTRSLTTEQHGAYFLLMQEYWVMGPPRDNDASLARIAGCSEQTWSSLRAALEHYFTIIDGRWRHKRIDEELAKAKSRKAKASKAARAKHAAEKERQKGAPSRRGAGPKHVLGACPSPSPSHTEIDAPIEQSISVVGEPSPSPAEGQATPRRPEGAEREHMLTLVRGLAGELGRRA